MYIYSGACKVGIVGEKTNLVTCKGEILYVGDIVLVQGPDGFFYSMSAVISDQFDWSIDENKKIVYKKVGEPNNFYIMGIKDAVIGGENGFIVTRVKRFCDAISGERWNDFGFSYSV